MHQIQCEKHATISEVIFCGKRNIKQIGIGCSSNFLLKARVLNLTILKQKNLSLSLKVETDHFVISLFLPECLSVKICGISPSDSEANHDGTDAESLFPLFFSFSATLMYL